MKRMKRIILTAAVALLALAAISGQAQTGTFQQMLDGAINDGAIGGGGWRATTGNFNIYSYDYAYSITAQTNGLGAGLIVGGDYMKGGNGEAVWNDVKGGFSVNYQFNLNAIGFSNTVFKVYGGNAIATPHNSGAGVGNITFVGVEYSLVVYKRLVFHISPAYQTRTGQGDFDRNYAGIQAFFSLGGGPASTLAANDSYLRDEYANLTPDTSY